MIEQQEIPEGFILVKKGGRPKMTLRDMAVFIAYQRKKNELGKGYLANDWIISMFNLNDAGHIRKCRANARGVIGKRWFAVDIDNRTFVVPTSLDIQGNIFAAAGAVGWMWGGGDDGEVATEFELESALSVASPKAAGSRWQPQMKKENW